MAVALAYPDKEKGGRGKKSGLNPEFIDTDPSYINKARFVLRHCLEKAEEVLSNPHYPPALDSSKLDSRVRFAANGRYQGWRRCRQHPKLVAQCNRARSASPPLLQIRNALRICHLRPRG